MLLASLAIEIAIPITVATIAAGPAYLGLRSLKGENSQQHAENKKQLESNSVLLGFIANEVGRVVGKLDITNEDVAELKTWTAIHDERHSAQEVNEKT
jgi:hypothetical protein